MYQPSPDQPVGWRGDGSGRYPGATPPTTWTCKQNGANYVTKGILWMAALPNTGVSSPIIVGDRIFVTTEVSDLVCLDKKTGRILWIRSNLEFEGLSEEACAAEPTFAQKLTPLAKQLAAANAEVVVALNTQRGTEPGRPPAPAVVRKREIEKQIQDEQVAIDKKGMGRYWGQAVFGFSGPTPTSDGTHVLRFLHNRHRGLLRPRRESQVDRSRGGLGKRAWKLRQSAAVRWQVGRVGQRNARLRRGIRQAAVAKPGKIQQHLWLAVSSAGGRRLGGRFSIGVLHARA